jgi:hypothetical protein
MESTIKMENIIQKFFGNKKLVEIYKYDEFLKLSEGIISNTEAESLTGTDKIYHDYRKINLQRTNRITKTFKPNDVIVDLVKKVDNPQLWLVITEDWCGDSAQNLPYIVEYLKFNPKIKLRVILRDSNLEAIDSHFTTGNPRSIPKVVGFDEAGNELFIWGPRPKFAQDLVQQLKAEGYSKDEFNKELHTWYAKNKGKELEKELLVIFQNISSKEH